MSGSSASSRSREFVAKKSGPEVAEGASVVDADAEVNIRVDASPGKVGANSQPLRPVWKFRQHDVQAASWLEKETGVSAVVARLLALRGIVRPDAARTFIEANLKDLRPPADLPGVTLAADLIYDLVKRQQRGGKHAQEKIAIYGDYDCDGMTATAILFRCLKMLKAQVQYFVPNRLDDGYGLNADAIRQLARDGVKMIVSVDCGIASRAEAELARELGISLIITDHHQPGAAMPDADAIVHPGIDGYPFAGLCGAGVALKLAWALCQRQSGQERVTPEARDFLVAAVELAAVGTVADVVPLIDENRLIVRAGLGFLVDSRIEGLRQLMALTGLDKKPQLGAEDIGFTLGPRLNAAGRLNQASLGVELLVSDSRQRVEQLAEYINNLNSSRDSIERKILKAARKQIDQQFNPEQEPAIVVADRGWHRGVIGIVAGRLAEKFHRPTVVISLDETDTKRPGVGSGRSALGIDLYQALGSAEDHLVQFGGHRAAAGLQIEPHEVDAFREAFFEGVSQQADVLKLEPELAIDIEAAFAELTLPTLREMERMAPFGQDNPRPVLCASEVNLVGEPKRMGEGGRHLSLQLEQHGIRLRAVAFGNGDWAEELAAVGGSIDVVFKPSINEFRGMRSVQLQLMDWRVSATR